jgi:hypothetical protein
MDPYLTVRMRRLVWIHGGPKHMLVLSWRGSLIYLPPETSILIAYALLVSEVTEDQSCTSPTLLAVNSIILIPVEKTGL